MDTAYLERLVKDDNDVDFLEKWLARKKSSLKRQLQKTQSNDSNKFSKAGFSLSWEPQSSLELSRALERRTTPLVLLEMAACAAAAAASASASTDGVSSVQFFSHTEDGKLTLVRSNRRIPSASPESPRSDPSRWSQVLSAGPTTSLPGVPDYGDISEIPDEDDDPVGSVFGSFVGLTVGEDRPDSPGMFSQIPAGVLRAARSRETVRLDGTTFQEDHVLCLPVQLPCGELPGVVELRRPFAAAPFSNAEEAAAMGVLSWAGAALHYAEHYRSQRRLRALADFHLNVVKSIFQDMVSMDVLVTKIMKYAQRLVDADRASLFLLDSRSNELYARIFDIGGNAEKADHGSEIRNAITNREFAIRVCENEFISIITTSANDKMRVKETEEARFPTGTGIAGHVAKTGENLNIPDAYADPRFNRAVDTLTGYRTRTILCMPVRIRGTLIGVVQMVNKREGTFTKEDEEAFETFAVYCGLALHHAKLYDKIRRSEQKYQVALDVLSYHNTCRDDELQEISDGLNDEEETSKAVLSLETFDFDPASLDDMAKARQTVVMFRDLFGLRRFDLDTVGRFVLTVRKNYRVVPYHNWSHGFAVANSMYAIIKRSSNTLHEYECIALFIAALCHDLDHRGKSNQFMVDSESPLAAIYGTSTMERHHFNQTVTILQQQGHNIFQKLTSSEYKAVLSLVKHCILATDLTNFFPTREKLSALQATASFRWDDTDHRMLLLAVAMTGSDLSASAKPWTQQIRTARVIFDEFYEQGDEERAAGRQPQPMMDRLQPQHQATSQVGFLNGICIPCYSLMGALLPKTAPMLDRCKDNLRRWTEIQSQQDPVLELDD